MSYATDEFWKAYKDYINESFCRHQEAVRRLAGDLPVRRRNTLDLGCGKFQEARRLFNPKNYFGVDMDPPGKEFTMKADYRTEWGIIADAVMNGEEPLYPDLVVSLFSTEITAPSDTNYKLYETIFNDLPTVKLMLLAGFYYTDKMDTNPVEEVGGLKSYQTLDLMGENAVFTEKRLYIPAPSKLFGPNVVEVWKLLLRR